MAFVSRAVPKIQPSTSLASGPWQPHASESPLAAEIQSADARRLSVAAAPPALQYPSREQASGTSTRTPSRVHSSDTVKVFWGFLGALCFATVWSAIRRAWQSVPAPPYIAMAATTGTIPGAYGQPASELEGAVWKAINRADITEIDDVGFQRALYASLEGIFKETQAITRAQAEALMANMSALMMRLGHVRRRTALTVLLTSLERFLQNIFEPPAAEARASSSSPRPTGKGGPTNEVVGVVDGIRQKRLGGGDIIVSEMGLGTQRWASADFNAPDEALCHKFMDRAILESGVNLIDTAEQYPIPSDFRRPEGLTEEVIGRWHKQDPSRREKIVIATKITGGSNVTRRNIIRDCEDSLKRLQTDYIDVYLLHWPARYSPQANWGQSLAYNYDMEAAPWYQGAASFEEICLAMGELIKSGKIRGWGMCNDNAFGLTACCEVAKRLGVPPPVSMQNDFSMNDRRAEENGVAEASSPIHENVGFMAYNALCGGILTGKYMEPRTDKKTKRGRFDEPGWGRTLYRYYSGPALASAEVYKKLAEKNGMSLTELSLRWCKERRAVTSTLLGQTSMEQLEEDLKYFQNPEPLPDAVMNAIDIQHMRNRLPIFSSDDPFVDWDGRGDIGEAIP
eukprot:CAMPEP_0174287904 /NCGR_PEP_ID=MMETSP0809-20121228/18240_1 /TAXON_ID=73025 ORGANISM="Eutreptiella gymnastica-like, Strain CCMP1594" /NCGR_SAMPLE_ID=MMETSP0809 /ASSEMBLY_ACC=CAM_ASM_000658 /LENGTH=624 /DNA_ID=CAMNT_0015384739 /DNA_START=197 /DNA_END=2071 /DNA_ORIENTATION=-